MSVEAILFSWILKLTLLLTAAWFFHFCLRRANPRWRVWLWRCIALAAITLTTLAPRLGSLRIELPWEEALPPSLELVADTIPAAHTSTSSHRPATSRQIPQHPPVLRNFQNASTSSARLATQRRASTAVSHSPLNRGTATQAFSKGELVAVPIAEEVSVNAGSQISLPSMSRNGWLIVAWLLGLAIAVFKCLIGALRIRRVLRESLPAPAFIQYYLAPLEKKLKASPCRILVSSRVHSPSIFGILRSTILLPESMCSPAHQRDLQAALAHELAHIKGFDLAWDRVLQLSSILIWFHPLCWKLRRAHRDACERVSDIVASDALGDRDAYKNSLASIALRLAQRVASEPIVLGFAMARRPDVVQRLRELTNEASAGPLGRGAIFLGTTLLSFVAFAGVTSIGFTPRPATAQEKPAPTATEKEVSLPAALAQAGQVVPQFLLTVVDADTGQAVVDSKVEFRMYGKDLRFRRFYRTDAEGQYVFDYPAIPSITSMNVTVRAPGFVPYNVDFGRELTEISVPAEKTIRLRQGVAVGGTVTDGQGNPISGAELDLYLPVTETNRRSYVFSLLENDKTDDEGKWFVDGAPEPVTGLNIRIDHPDFLRASFPLQSGTEGEFILRRGWSIRGTIRSPDGKPVADAVIHTGDDRFGSGDPKARTGEDGRYVLKGLKREPTILTVTAPHLTPQTTTVSPADEPRQVDFDLQEGHTIRFKVVDKDGKPAKGVEFAADTWRGLRTLQLRVKVDDNGEFVWDGAPAESVQFDFFGGGFSARRNFAAVQREEPYVVVMNRPTVVDATVTDSETGKPIPEFTAQFGWPRSRADDISWHYAKSEGRNGRHQFRYDETQEELYVRVEAPGYLPWISERFEIAENVNLKVPLERGTGLTGRVLTPDGQPASSTRVILVTKSEGMQFSGGYRSDGGAQRVDTQQDGRFELQPLANPDEPGLLVFVHDEGYKEVPLREYSEYKPVQLAAWARVEVQVLQQGKPLPKADVSIQPKWKPGVSVFGYNLSGATDQNGRIAFEKVVPFDCWIGRTLAQPIGSGFMKYTDRGQNYSLQPGETKSVTIGGEGTLLTGVIKLPPKPPGPFEWSVNEAGSLITADTRWDDPKHRRFRFLYDHTGKFELFDVPPGKYKFEINLTEQQDPNLCGTGRNIGSVESFEIEVKAGQESLELGKLQAEWIDFLGAGDAAPEFVAYDAEGKKVRLSDLRGKLVLLDFWATWCSPCISEMPELLELHKKHADDPRFVLIGLALDKEFQSAADLMKKNGWSWMCLNGGRGTSSLIPSRYEVSAIPQKFLIGPDGQIIARKNRLEDLPELVAKTLRNLPKKIEVAKSHAGFQAHEISDPFVPSGEANVAMAWAKPYFASGQEVVESHQGVTLYGAKGEIRTLGDMTPGGWLTRPDRLAYDRKRGRLYVITSDGKVNGQHLEAIDKQVLRRFRVHMPNLQAVAVDEKTGDIWCIVTSYLNEGETVILDQNGHEKDRLPLAGFTLRYSAASDGFWFVGDEVKIVARNGEVLARHAIPNDAYTLAAVAVDKKGGCYALEDDHPDVVASRNRLWHFDREAKPTMIAEFPVNERDADRYITPTWVEVIGSEVWIGIVDVPDRDDRKQDVWTVRRYDASGKQVGEFRQQCTAASAVASGKGIWILGKEKLVHFDSAGRPGRKVSLPQLHKDGNQSGWVLSLD